MIGPLIEELRRVLNEVIVKRGGEFCLVSRKKNPKTGRRRNLGCYPSRAGAEKRERQVQFFKRQKG
jgi:hypothetical protein